jgi:hypothetical protein
MGLAEDRDGRGEAWPLSLLCFVMPWALALYCPSTLAATPALADNDLPAMRAEVLDQEPPALRAMLERARRLETDGDEAQGDWKAAAIHCQAARLGSLEARFRLGMQYAFGLGLPRHRAWAAALFSSASTQGHAEAHWMLETIQYTSRELPPCVLSWVDPAPGTTPPPSTGLPAGQLAAASEAGADTGALARGRAPAQDPGLAPAHGRAGGHADGHAGGHADAAESSAIDRHLQALPPSRRWIVPLVETVGSWYGIDPKLALSVIAVESGFRTQATSPKDAMGLMQLIPATAERFNVRDAYDATQNLRGGIAYLRWLLARYRGDVRLAVAAYNAGERRVDRHRGVPPIAETREYVLRVMALYGRETHPVGDKAIGAQPTPAKGKEPPR